MTSDAAHAAVLRTIGWQLINGPQRAAIERSIELLEREAVKWEKADAARRVAEADSLAWGPSMYPRRGHDD